MSDAMVVVLAILVFVAVTIAKGVRIVPQGEEWIVERLGKYFGTLKPGLNIIIPYLDKVAYKEVNFKSKLIEWCQKNRVKLDFKLIEQKRDENNNPIFVYQAIVEGLEGGSGKGYSKKESQQLASKLTLEKLRKEPQYIDSVFTAKANRTKMEEEPVLAVPTTEVKNDFIISQDTEKQESEEKHVNVFKEEVYSENSSAEDVVASTVTEEITTTATQESEDEFDLSDISAEPKEMSREDIIAAAEAAAFAEDKE